MSLTPGVRLGPYEVLAPLGAGGMGEVWSDGRYAQRGNRMFDLHPAGDRFALAPAPQTQAGTKQDKVTFIFNFFDELRRIAPVTNR